MSRIPPGNMALTSSRGTRSNGLWPGLSQPLSDAFSMVMAGATPDLNLYNVRPHTLYHRLDYVAGGQATLQYFQVAPSKHICNLPAQGTFPNEQAFRLEAVRIIPETGITAAATYTRAAAGAQAFGNAAIGYSTATVAEELRTILLGGLVNMSLGEKKIITDVYSLLNFPAGAGFSLDCAAGNGSAAGGTAFAIINNGRPETANGYFMRPPVPWLPGQKIDFTIDWQAALAVTTAFVLRVELDGTYITPR